MDIHYAESVGFLESWQDTYNLLKAPMMRAMPRGDQFDHVAVYADESGANLCLFETVDGFSSMTLTVNGPQRVSVSGWQVVPGVACLSVYGEDDEELTTVLVWVDDPHMYPIHDEQSDGPESSYHDYRLGAIAADVTVFDSVEQWRQTQTPISLTDSPVDSTRDGLPQEVYIGPRFVASPWLFALQSGEAQPVDASPISMFKAVCGEVRVVTNKLTGKQWYQVDADCGVPVTLALPIGIMPAPHPGSVVDGKAFLTGSTGFWLDDYQRK